MITPEFPPKCGGIGYYVYNLSKNLIKRGHEITVFTRGNWNSKYISTNFEDINVYKVRYFPIHPFSMQLHGIFLNKSLKMHLNCYDFVHIHNPTVPMPKVSCPVIVTQHGLLLNDIENTKMININALFSKMLKKWFVYNEIKALKSSKIITTVSNSCAAEIKSAYKIGRYINVVKNGVDTDYFIPKKEQTKEGYILYTGRLHSRKGLLDLIDCAKHIAKKNHSIKFVITGEGPLKDTLISRIKKYGLRDNVELTGYVDRDQLLNYYQNASIYILPSYYEGLPTSLLEAMSCGIACVATNVPGNSELIIDGKNGFLTPSNDPIALAGKIQELLDCEHNRKIMGSDARKYIVENYDWKIIAANLERIYKQL